MSPEEISELKKRNEFLESVLVEAHYPLTQMPREYTESSRIEALKEKIRALENDLVEAHNTHARRSNRFTELVKDLSVATKELHWKKPSMTNTEPGQQCFIRTPAGHVHRAMCIHREGKPVFMVNMTPIEMDAQWVCGFPEFAEDILETLQLEYTDA
jgi:hypothetical protein